MDERVGGIAVENVDFLDIIKSRSPNQEPAPLAPATAHLDTTEGTTILALRFKSGVMVAGDRRATMGNVVIYDRADKVLAVDDSSVLALAGSPANAYEIARMLEISFQHYRRSQLQEMSMDGKLRTLSRLLRENIPMAMQGIGAVIPIFATFDEQSEASKIYFYDILGAQFESVDFCTTGSGSPTIRGALYYHNRWTGQPTSEMEEPEAIALALRMLETAAEYDTATGGHKPTTGVFPQVMCVTRSGVTTISETELESHYENQLS